MGAMKNFQIFLTEGRVRYAAADHVEVRQNQVILYEENRNNATYERPSVIMMDEFRLSSIAPFAHTPHHGIRTPGTRENAAPTMLHLEPALQTVA
jgi:hypothetical protein